MKISPLAGQPPPPSMLLEFQDQALGLLEEVRVIPQAHKIMMLP